MARGQQKIQAQQKNAKKNAGKNKGTQRGTEEAQLTVTCPVCMARMPSVATLKVHFEARHPKAPTPDILKDNNAGEGTSKK